jgi:hypothetical protein
MPRIVTVFLLLMASGCVHRRIIDPVPLVPMNSCVLITVTGLTLTYPAVSGRCLSAKMVIRSIKKTASKDKN